MSESQPQSRPAGNPRTSIIVIVYSMPRQAMNTLYSLSQDYQRDLPSADYEIIVVENRSGACLNSEEVEELGPQFRYFLRNETGVSPAAAINFGFDQARGDYIGLMIDGMLGPFYEKGLADLKSVLEKDH
jgi:glycosyltransferase involved in cell wall biosynthesis